MGHKLLNIKLFIFMCINSDLANITQHINRYCRFLIKHEKLMSA